MKSEFLARGLAVAALAVALLVGPARAMTLEEVRADGFIRLGLAIEAPYAFVTAEGRVTGEAPEVARAVFHRLGVPNVSARIVDFENLIPGLLRGEFDVIAAGMFITPERCARVAFSRPTFGVGQAFLVVRGNPLGLETYVDVARTPDARLAVLAGAVEGDFARMEGVPDDRLVVVRAPAAGLRAVTEGEADAFALSQPSIRRLAQSLPPPRPVEAVPAFDAVGGRSVVGHGALAFRPEDADLRDAVDAELAAFIGSTEHLALVAPFGFGEETLPSLDRAELCRGNGE